MSDVSVAAQAVLDRVDEIVREERFVEEWRRAFEEGRLSLEAAGVWADGLVGWEHDDRL